MRTIRQVAGAAPGTLRFVEADLVDAASMTRAAAEIGSLGGVLGVHAAADVSWEKTAEEMSELNVDGTFLFAELLCSISSAPRLVYLSTAYTGTEGWTYRNGYEVTKAEAERRLRAEFGHIPTSTFACSLVVGNTTDGQIGRYNGIYPILRFLAEFAPPFLVGRKDAMLDVVPIDWVCDELTDLCADQIAGGGPRTVIAAAGPERRTSFERLVRIGEERLAAFDDLHGLPRAEPIPILRSRQWAFLKRSLKAWQPPDIAVGDFRYFERLLQIYGTYFENDAVRDPVCISFDAPNPETFLPVVVDRWLNDHADRLISRRRKSRVPVHA